MRAWQIHKGYTAPQAAGVIHTDFEKGFIKADIVSYDDFVAAEGSMTKIKEEGKLRQEGRDYVMAGRRHRRIQVQRFQVGSSDPRKRRDSKGSGVSELLESRRFSIRGKPPFYAPYSGRFTRR